MRQHLPDKKKIVPFPHYAVHASTVNRVNAVNVIKTRSIIIVCGLLSWASAHVDGACFSLCDTAVVRKAFYFL